MDHVAIRLEDADAGAGGRARLRFPGVSLPVGQPALIGLTIRCSDSGEPWLGPDGWQASEHTLQPDKVAIDGGDLVLEVGPSIVDRIPPFQVIEVGLPSLGLSGTVSWEGITQSYAPAPPSPPPDVPPPPPPLPPDVPPPPPPEVGRFAFHATPERCISFRPIGRASGVVLNDLQPGGVIGGLDFAELAQAFAGEIERTPDGHVRITTRSSDGPPARLDFRAGHDGDIILHRPGGQHGPFATLARNGGPIFGIPRAELRGTGQGSLLLDAATLKARLVAGAGSPWPAWAGRPFVLGLAALLLLLFLAGGYAFWPWGPAPADEEQIETAGAEQPPTERPSSVPAEREVPQPPVEPGPPPADPLPDAADGPVPDVDPVEPPPVTAPVPSPVQTEPAPPVAPPPEEPPAAAEPPSPAERRPPVQPAPAPPPAPVPPATTPPPTTTVGPGPTAPFDDLLPSGRGSGHKLLARKAETERQEGCADRPLPFLRVVESNVDPVRLPAGGTFSHRIIYALCPAQPGVQLTAKISRELRAGGDVLLATEADGFALRPGTWASDEEFVVPPNTVPGNYTVYTRVTFAGRDSTSQSDLVIE